MKTPLILYGLLILGFIAYQLFFRHPEPRIHEAISILYTSVLFLYIGFLAYRVLKGLKKRQQYK
ncbi:hypothetical protein [Planobacterium oryzisoli]|uniref:Uncharacterized protein n=1 Tax=Planobacterium oryzisoli TaxID=2771435 RepID=A0A930YV95_9FLAO|nr:hypothetical protein [Planobacterium oryzisoli]MBF5027014.1 hypothetical protein [Planobacterium oryzisoli]